MKKTLLRKLLANRGLKAEVTPDCRIGQCSACIYYSSIID